jgi:hypothetical protein
LGWFWRYLPLPGTIYIKTAEKGGMIFFVFLAIALYMRKFVVQVVFAKVASHLFL